MKPLQGLFVARGAWQRKGLPFILEALELARRDFGLSFTLHIVGQPGTGEEKMLAPYHAWQDSGCLILHGVLGDVEPAYRASDVLLVASHYEAFSLVMLDALKFGLPMVTTRVNGAVEMVREGENGFIVDRDARAFAGRLCALADSPDLRYRMGAASLQLGRQFAASAVAARYEEVYRQLLG